MSKAIQGAVMIAGAAGMLAFGMATGGWVFAIPMYDQLMASLAIGGVALEAGAIANALSQNRGTNITIRQPAAQRQIIYGERRVGGILVYSSTTGSAHDQYNAVVVLAGHEVDSIVNMYIDGRQVYWNGGIGHATRNGVGFGGIGDGADHVGPGGQHYNFGGTGHSGIYVEPRFGDQTSPNGTNSPGVATWWGTPTSVIGGLTANDPAWAGDGAGNFPWLGGCAYVYVKLEYNTSLFPGGPAQAELKFTVRGKKVYDPRTATWGYSSNWALIVNDILTNTETGLGDVNGVNQAQLIAAANVCDEMVTLANGNTERRYAAHAVFDTSLAPGDQLAKLMPAAAGRLSRIGGEWYIWPAYWQGPSFSFETADVSGPLTGWKPNRKLRELYNRVNGTYIAANVPYNDAGNLYDSNGWYNGTILNNWPFGFQPTNYPQYAQDTLHGYSSDAWLLEDSGVKGAYSSGTTYAADDAVTESGQIYLSLQDANTGNDPATSPTWWVAWAGNLLPFELPQDCCLSVSQAQRVAKIMLLRNRQQGSGPMPMHLTAWQMQPCDVFTLDFAPFGWIGKQLEVTATRFYFEKQEGENGRSSMAVRFEVTAQDADISVYEWTPAGGPTDELGPYDVPANPANMPWGIDAPTSLTLLSDATTAVLGADGINHPRVLATWVDSTDVRAVQVQVQYKLAAAMSWTDAPPVAIGTLQAYISNVIGGSSYDVQIRSVSANGSVSAWTSAGPVTAAAPSSLTNSYTNSPALALTQPTSTTIHMAAVATTFGATVVNYAARTLTITAPSVPTWYYLTIADPTQVGESGSPTLTATASTSNSLAGVLGNTYMGAILALPAGSANRAIAGGWPAPVTVQVI